MICKTRRGVGGRIGPQNAATVTTIKRKKKRRKKKIKGGAGFGRQKTERQRPPDFEGKRQNALHPKGAGWRPVTKMQTEKTRKTSSWGECQRKPGKGKGEQRV